MASIEIILDVCFLWVLLKPTTFESTEQAVKITFSYGSQLYYLNKTGITAFSMHTAFGMHILRGTVFLLHCIFMNCLFLAFSPQCYRVTEIGPTKTVSEKSYNAHVYF